MRVTVETWIVKDLSKLEEHDQFFMRWMEHVLSSLGQSVPSHRYLSQREPEGGRVLIIEYANDEDERKFDRMRVEDEKFAKFRDELMSKYARAPPKILPCDEIMQDTITEMEKKYR